MCHSLVAASIRYSHTHHIDLHWLCLISGSSWSWNGIKCHHAATHEPKSSESSWLRALFSWKMWQEEEEEGSETPEIANTFQQLAWGNDKRGTREPREDRSEICNRSGWWWGGGSDTGSQQNLKADERGWDRWDKVWEGRGEKRWRDARLFLEVIKAEKDWGRFAWQDLWEQDGGSRQKKHIV